MIILAKTLGWTGSGESKLSRGFYARVERHIRIDKDCRVLQGSKYKIA
jgi:hypothetical protein